MPRRRGSLRGPITPAEAEKGFTFIELLVVITIATLLLTVALPSVAMVRAQVRVAVCASRMHALHVGLMNYAADNQRLLPPFAFSDYSGDVPQSGHWGGADEFGRLGVRWVNLWTLVLDSSLNAQQLICPGAPCELIGGTVSMFELSNQFSTYTVRIPPSEAMFTLSPNLAYHGRGSLLGIYAVAAGGQPMRVGMSFQTVPQVHVARRYPVIEAVSVGDGDYDAPADTLMSDTFWQQDQTGSGVRAAWCHGDRFNALAGDGAVRIVTDDGTIAANSNAPGATLPDDGENYTTYAERIWQFFDAAKK